MDQKINHVHSTPDLDPSQKQILYSLASRYMLGLVMFGFPWVYTVDQIGTYVAKENTRAQISLVIADCLDPQSFNFILDPKYKEIRLEGKTIYAPIAVSPEDLQNFFRSLDCRPPC